MSDEYTQVHETLVHEETFSSFWPVLILAVGFLAWLGIQDYELFNQRLAYDKQIQAAAPTIAEAQNINARYVALMKDLVETAQHDEAAANIVKAAIQAHLIQVNPNAANAGSASSTPSTPSSTDSSKGN